MGRSVKKPRSQQNRILESLPASELSRLTLASRLVELGRDQVLCQAGRPMECIYFPVGCVVSFLGNTGNGGSVEIWSVGPEGLVGLSGIFDRVSPFQAVVQIPGSAWAVKRALLLRHFRKGGKLHDAILRYYECLLVQASQLGVCNNAHGIEQRFSRWLLMLQDRSGGDQLSFTQDCIADALGTRRATISVAAAALQNAKLISYTPGLIRINSRRGLQAATCDCYKVIKAQFDAA